MEIGNLKDMVIIGGGPAGLVAGIYAMRGGVNAICIEKENAGGKIAEAGIVENYLGYSQIKGFELANNFAEHANSLNLPIIHEEVISVVPNAVIIHDENGDNKINYHKVITKNNEYITKTIVIASGSKYKSLGINEDDYVGKGVGYCVMCDAFFFKDRHVLVIGRNTPAAMAAYNLRDIAKKITIITDKNEIKVVEKIMMDRLKKIENLEIIYNAKPIEFKGTNKFEGIEVELTEKDSTKEIKEIKKIINGDGAFIMLGYTPNSEFLQESGINLKKGFVITNKECETNIEGIYACGDITGGILQVSKAVGEGVYAFSSASKYLQKFDK
ncbi:F420-dependent thioredoxin reductase [Methanococcus voltae]|uniref:FAD-dependent pyridine nucleotide-disulfide oxidoreductase n=1 Tax=Methanococcus voltae (strain ATCC BAA-1334 / A3) TaxID=456320 RepID=D7DT65_METV3|nr:F420-dependent thioredoxin reductase [Methanococcus voltae]MCS3901819.1 thioredoxin reductase (NADPH) [Methanococcus voltae]